MEKRNGVCGWGIVIVGSTGCSESGGSGHKSGYYVPIGRASIAGFGGISGNVLRLTNPFSLRQPSLCSGDLTHSVKGVLPPKYLCLLQLHTSHGERGNDNRLGLPFERAPHPLPLSHGERGNGNRLGLSFDKLPAAGSGRTRQGLREARATRQE